MARVEAHITVDCAGEKQHLAVSTLLKTICQALDMGIETNNSGSDMSFKITGAHPDSKTEYVGAGKQHPLRTAFGL